jgi:ATP-dependent Lon protease
VTDRIVPALPLPGGVVMPQMVVTISAESPEAIAAAASAGESGELLLVPKIGDRYAKVGALARVESTGTLPGGAQALVVRATGRARIGHGVVGTGAGLWVTAEPIPELPASDEARRLGAELRATLRVLFERLGGRRLVEILGAVGTDDPGALADLAGWWPELPVERKVELLETVDVEARVALVLGWAKEALAESELAEKISSEVREGIDSQQREFLLRRQLDAIRKELGEDEGDGATSADSFRERIDALDTKGAPEAVVKALRKELTRFEKTPAQAAERGWIEGWLDTVLDVPWTERTVDHLVVDAARTTLVADHSGREEV